MGGFEFTTGGAAHAGKVERLLAQCGLPNADIGPHLEHFTLAWADGELAGVVGLELLAPHALLRSLAVAPDFRGRGLARALCAHAAELARQRGARELYLLTTTAEGFFGKLGYAVVARGGVPATVRGTEEFRALCPASAVCMSLRIAEQAQ
jgi:amino-acid N-acetyltransferase